MKKLIALLLALVMVLSLVACGGTQEETPTTDAPATETPETPTDAPATEPPAVGYSEAPSITELGTYGNVEGRLPVEEDIFVSVNDANGDALDIGTYGGIINLVGGGGSWDISRPTLETIIRRDNDGTYYPNVIKSYEYNEDYTVWTFHLREGMKWSDGNDFNADDITFWYYMCHINNYDTKASWAALKDGDDFAKLEKVDDYRHLDLYNPQVPC
jgi:peptide/nickel transport system substrate-binding protein